MIDLKLYIKLKSNIVIDMEKIKHKVKPVMLPTDKASYIGVCIKEISDVKIGELRIFSSPMFMSLEYWQPQHLYITVSQDVESIKEGDWYIDDCNTLRQSITNDKDYWEVRQDYRKIIATNDNLINIPVYPPKGSYYIGKLQQSFIKEYVDNPDAEYEVEYEYDCERHPELEGTPIIEEWSWVKVNPDNTVNITSVEKKMYSGEEVEILLKNISMESYIHGLKIGSGQEAINRGSWNSIDWIKENL
jgi:hypothetical protein